jgi:Sulfotransferase family
VALPDFFIVGAPKAGTTALHAALAAHPALFMSTVKEPKFFLTDGPPPSRGGGPGDVQTYREHIWRREEYEALFAAAPPGTLRGESTPFYLYRTDAQERIRALIPDAKLIVILRDPVERAHSNWTHLWSAGLEPIGNFVGACAEEDARAAAGWADFWHYTRLGRYGEQLENLFLRFPREQVFILRYRALIGAPAQTLDDLCQFLGVHPGIIGHVPKQNVTAHPDRSLAHLTVSKLLRRAAAAGRHLPGSAGTALTQPLERFLQQNAGQRQPLSWEQRQEVLPYFEDDIRLLERITETYFGDWLQPRERAGGLVGARPAGQYQARNGRPVPDNGVRHGS